MCISVNTGLPLLFTTQPALTETEWVLRIVTNRMVCLCVPFSPCTSDPASWECMWAMEDQFDWALWRKTRTTAILASVWARWAVQVETSLPSHSKAQQFSTDFHDKPFVICHTAPSSVTERPHTAGVWTRTGERLLEPDHMMLSNLHVNILSTWLCVCVCVHVLNQNLFFFSPHPSRPRPSLSCSAHSAPVAPP